ncbi:flagellar biosynthetic protein FliR [Legionella fairfieldensis]|uniref:flagellar biosynthetic protein FliR n=1 Tax=Legionella fairfieldensis TaxID=45064 RepID=UPI00048BBC7A|nr:flagellar biosynthetic protein FliR [Legionella fairfieldensis]
MINVAMPTLTAFFLVAIRTGVILLFTPIQAIRQLPVSIRLILVLGLSALFVSNLSLTIEFPNQTALFASSLIELSNGLILLLSFYAAFAVFQIAGQLIDTQTGFNSLAIFNPGDQSQDPLMSRLLIMLAVLFFFSINGHHWLIQGLACSFLSIPLGELTLFNHFSLIISQFSFMFILGLMIASPIVTGLLLIDLCSAILTRNMPQISTYFLALPVKILFGFFLLTLMLSYINPLMERAFVRCFQIWHQVME